ncbi:MAG: rod shape-determining protein MreC, partial [Cyclobacteriaceae bacterium]|nr:rod shape-determining protein MreC [Cyclobacteriaceae bacterium]
MQRFFQFLFKYRAFFLFVILEVLSLFLVFQVNSYHGTRFFHSANTMTAGILESSQNIYDYFSLVETNKILADENASLRESLLNESSLVNSTPSIKRSFSRDSTKMYDLLEARIINNSVFHLNNFITVNRGKVQGVEPGMAVLGPDGVVGIVRNVSNNYAVLYSLLNSNVIISVRLTSTDDIASVKWDGVDYQYAKLLYLPRHIKVNLGDTIVTSGFGSIFPENNIIGVVD